VCGQRDRDSAALEEDASATTSCPHCSAETSIAGRRGIPADHDDLVPWLPTSSCTHVVTEFRPDVTFFCSHEHLEKWRTDRGHPEGEIRSAEEAALLGRQWWGYLRPPGAAEVR
jgi:Alkylmercury lyase